MLCGAMSQTIRGIFRHDTRHIRRLKETKNRRENETQGPQKGLASRWVKRTPIHKKSPNLRQTEKSAKLRTLRVAPRADAQLDTARIDAGL